MTNHDTRFYLGPQLGLGQGLLCATVALKALLWVPLIPGATDPVALPPPPSSVSL